jgi:transposase
VSIHQLEIRTGTVRRRKFTQAAKEAIVSETLSGETTVTDVARRYDVDRSLVYRWRREFGVAERLEEPCAFVPVKVQQAADAAIAMPGAATSSAIEIHVGRGRLVRVNRDFDASTLSRVLDVLEGR